MANEKVGTPLCVGYAFPHSRPLGRIPAGLSKEATRRLKWMDHYTRTGNARLTCRYFGVSPTTFYKWHARYKKMGPRGLEERSRRPKRIRTSQIPQDTIALIVALRQTYPAWSKYKLAHIAARDYDVVISASSVGRMLKAKGLICQLKRQSGEGHQNDHRRTVGLQRRTHA